MTAGSGILHRVAAMGHDYCRMEPSEDPAQSEGEAGVESLGGAVARGMPEGQVELHLGRAVEKAEQSVADDIQARRVGRPERAPRVAHPGPAARV